MCRLSRLHITDFSIMQTSGLHEPETEPTDKTMKKFRVVLCFLVSLIINLHLASSSDSPVTKQDDWITKEVIVGDEFPAISIGILTSKTEYSVQLDTTNHDCEDGYTCVIYIYLVEMFCKKENNGTTYLAIEGTTVTNKSVNINWCRDNSLSGDTIKDEFVQVRQATVRPIGDWSHTNATVSILSLFTMEQPLQTKIVSEEEPSTEFYITDSKFQYNSYYNGSCFVEDDNNNFASCSIACRIQMNCTTPKTTGVSTDLQLTAVLMNNETISKNLCPNLLTGGERIGSGTTTESHENGIITVTKYLHNIQQLLITPLGDWKSTKTVALVSIDTFHDPGNSQEDCPETHFNCNSESCDRNLSWKITTDDFTTIDDDQDVHCVPWTWICGGEDTKFCPQYCHLAQKYCPQIINSSNSSSSTNSGTTDKYVDCVSKLRRSVFYYSFFAVAILLILFIFFGTAYILRIRKLDADERSRRPFSNLFSKFRRDIPYQIVEENV